ncbi:MAG: response regulator [Planctomycetes bacterium]|nr:response regulator [Planctomycetota bacterium]
MEKYRILVVDDEPQIRKILTTVLKKNEAYEVFDAEDGDQALEFLKERNFDWDLVVTDMQMPRMNGFELITELNKQTPKIATLVLTAHKSDENVVKCLEQGAFDYIEKPIAVKEFLKTVHIALERYKRFAGQDDDLTVKQEIPGWIEITAPSDFEYVERFRKFTSILGDTPLTEDEKNDIRVAIDELGQNAIEWGNRKEREKRIHLSYCLFEDRIVFKVEDEGEGFDVEKLRDPSKDPFAHIAARMQEGKRAGGYGVHMTKKLMDDIVYNEKGNVVIFTKLFEKATGITKK